jgi:hypothetical protein
LIICIELVCLFPELYAFIFFTFNVSDVVGLEDFNLPNINTYNLLKAILTFFVLQTVPFPIIWSRSKLTLFQTKNDKALMLFLGYLTISSCKYILFS